MTPALTRAEQPEDAPALIPLPRHDVPRWVYSIGLGMHGKARRLILSAGPHMDQANEDGIPQVAPILAAYGAPVQVVRQRVGKGRWRFIHHSKLEHNAWRCKLILMTRLDVDTILALPTGALREACGMWKENPTVVPPAARIAQNRDQMREAVMLCRDLARMGGVINDRWSLRRLREEHDAEARRWAFRHADPTPWADEWCHEVDGYRFTLLRSAVDFKAEGLAQRNCISSYAELARRGDETAFRIEGAARASVSFGRGGRCELKLACNRHAPDAVYRAATKAWAAYRAGAAALHSAVTVSA